MIGVAVFALLSGAAVALLAFDRPLELVGARDAVGPQPGPPRLGAAARHCPSACGASATGLLGTLGPRGSRRVVATVGRWAFDYATLLAALAAVGAHPRPSLVLLAFCAAQVLAQIPITPGGLGFVEAGLTAMLALAGVGAGARCSPPSPTGCSPTGCRCRPGLGALRPPQAPLRAA